MYEKITYELLVDRMKGRISNALDKREGSVIDTALKPAAAEIQIMYIGMDHLLNEQRRKKVMAKMQGRGTTTRQMIKEIAALFSGGEVTVTEDNPASLFTVQFIGIRPYDMQAFISTIEEIKPAHLAMGLCERYPEQYTVPVRYENTIHFRMGFYPRGNIRRLILDGGWALDGAGYRLTGYDSMDHIDFCPVQITIRNSAEKTVQTAGRVMQVNRLDGRWKLDAKRRLDGGVYTL